MNSDIVHLSPTEKQELARKILDVNKSLKVDGKKSYIHTDTIAALQGLFFGDTSVWNNTGSGTKFKNALRRTGVSI